MNIDDLSPTYIGEDRFKLTLDTNSVSPLVYQIVQINVDYSGAEPDGSQLPLEMLIQGPDEGSYIEKVFRRIRPASLSFKPVAAGTHLVILRERAHNRWIGRLRVEVGGDPFTQV